MKAPILEAVNISKRFHVYTQQKTLFRLGKSLLKGTPIRREFWALKNIHFQIAEGEKIAVVGRNGAGKTTLLRLMAGIYRPNEGEIKTRKTPQPLFSYGIGLNPFLSVLDNIFVLGAFHGLVAGEVKRALEDIVEFSGLRDFLHAPAKDLSSGQKQRLLFSVFIHNPSDFLLFDESTSMADLEFQIKTDTWFEKLMTSEKTLLICSHNLKFLEKHCTRAFWLEKGEIKASGEPAEVINLYKDFCRAQTEERLRPSGW